MTMKHYFFMGLIFCSLASSAATLEKVLGDYGLKVDSTKNFKLLKDQKISGTSKKQHLIDAQAGTGERIEIKIISPIDKGTAQSLVETEQTAMRKLYSAPQTPYMGDIAQALGGCPSAMGPIRENITLGGTEVEAWIGASHANSAFGACSAEEAKFKGALLIYYVPETQSVWRWRVFANWTGVKKSIDSNWLKQIVSSFKK